jgi:hypothetical protein
VQPTTKRRLSVIEPNEQLRGLGPPAFERLARRASVDSPAHRGLVLVCSTLARRATQIALPPSGQIELLTALETARLWVTGAASQEDVARARAHCFGSVSALEELTSRAISAARAHLPANKATPIDLHADHVVDRYARLGAHFAVSAVCHTLDAVAQPTAALDVPSDVEGSIAYQRSGLGSARHAAFRQAAWDQAQWEASRPPSADPKLLSVQVFHEYLGGRWKAHAESVSLDHDAFLTWALSAEAAKE